MQQLEPYSLRRYLLPLVSMSFCSGLGKSYTMSPFRCSKGFSAGLATALGYVNCIALVPTGEAAIASMLGSIVAATYAAG
jgi:hypothetical protein